MHSGQQCTMVLSDLLRLQRYKLSFLEMHKALQKALAADSSVGDEELLDEMSVAKTNADVILEECIVD
jgi:hypothetical protein